ncbi:MAG: hypothetical protein DRN83_02340 [Hadesarchaea archaeon]|nr:MAG: hypothetical protein DRN83_02340 [Hadesarchaea archaeon]
MVYEKSGSSTVQTRLPEGEPCGIVSETVVEELKAKLSSDDPKIAEEGIRKSLLLIQLYPEDFLEELLASLASAAWKHENFQRNLEESLADIAKNKPTYIPVDTLQKLSENKLWYPRWLTLWILNNMSYRHPNLVPTELLEKLTKDEKWWNREFAEEILNRVWRSRVKY